MCATNEQLRDKKRRFEAAIEPVDLDLDPLPWQSMTQDERRHHEDELETYFEDLHGIQSAECCTPSSSMGAGEEPTKRGDHDAKVMYRGAKILIWLE